MPPHVNVGDKSAVGASAFREAEKGKSMTGPRRVVIAGAGGRDFHNFNVVFRDDPSKQVVAFTATQIPGLAGRTYPLELAGKLYPQGIPILAEAQLEAIAKSAGLDELIFAYSDVSHAQVMRLASRALALGADFRLLGPGRTMLKTSRPTIAVSAIRTGCGKSQVARWIAERLRLQGLRVAVLRHPMPYGAEIGPSAGRFALMEDLDSAGCTLEEREEFEPHLAVGAAIYTGVDYAAVLALAEDEADVLLWEGGNNDFPFILPDLRIVLLDALRPEQAAGHHPGEAVARMADILLVAKSDAASPEAVARAVEVGRGLNPRALVIRGASPVRLDDPAAVAGRRVLVVEDGPTLTHGGMAHGAGYAAAAAAGAEIVDPRPWASGGLRAAFEAFPHIGPVLPALGYSSDQLDELKATIERVDADVVVVGTPVDLARLLRLAKPVVRARYEYAEMESPGLGSAIDRFVAEQVRR